MIIVIYPYLRTQSSMILEVTSCKISAQHCKASNMVAACPQVDEK